MTTTNYTEQFTKLGEDHGLERDSTSTGNEDFDIRLKDAESGERPILRYVAVTQAGEFSYLYDFDTLDEAKAKSIENVGDSIYAEFPESIVDLETGAVLFPNFTTIDWKVRS